ncbi:MAG: 3-phosphoshikimate 1-carboxyvinyltransferase [Oscillospiraceae bacterium]|nr:3-phosphoshikimate 1-carboxyvinyltransferase [Oscillospiraceae bacterium]
MNVTITPGRLSGKVTPPTSKSQGHRLLLAAALAEGESVICGLSPSRDIEATTACICALGARVEQREDGLHVMGRGGKMDKGTSLFFDCGESGSTLRFLIPIALAVAGGGSFTGHGRLMERPLKPYFDIFEEKDIYYAQFGDKAGLEGALPPGDYCLPGDVSSQFITGLLYALPLLEGDSRIVITTPLESRAYVDMTLDALAQFGITARWEGEQMLLVPGKQMYRPAHVRVEGDWSQAAFWLAARTLGSDIDVLGMDNLSRQGDKCIAACCEKLAQNGDVKLDVSQCPDLVPSLSAVAAVRRGTTRIVNAARLRMKESDRLTAVARVLNAMGARVEELPDGLVIIGGEGLTGGVEIDSYNDHRIAMMAAVAAVRCEKPVTILGAECVNKSYPAFWQDYRRLGGTVEEKGAV